MIIKDTLCMLMTFNYEIVISAYYDAFKSNDIVLVLCLFIGKQEDLCWR